MKLQTAVCVLAAIALFAATASAFAISSPYSASVALGADSETWIYTLSDHDTVHDLTIMGFEVNWDNQWDTTASNPLPNITGSPSGWDAWGLGPQDQSSWPNWGASSSNEPSGGHSLPGFQITLAKAGPAPLFFHVSYLDEEANSQDQYGSVTASVPEPMSIFALLTGLVGICPRIRKRTA